MGKAPLDIIAENLPTFADLYNRAPDRMPSDMRLAKEAQRIMAALAAAGFQIIKLDDGQSPSK